MNLQRAWCPKCERLRLICLVREVQSHWKAKGIDAQHVSVTLVCGHDAAIVITPPNLAHVRRQQALAERWLDGERYVA